MDIQKDINAGDYLHTGVILKCKRIRKMFDKREVTGYNSTDRPTDLPTDRPTDRPTG